MRIIVMCGKGGVGKTTLAAALGVQAAKLGKRALVFSVDPAHSLGAAMDTPLGPQPTRVAPNLWGAELEAIAEVESEWADAKAYAASLMESQGLEGRLGGEIAQLPGVTELAALIKLKQIYDAKQFDVVIVDNAPTAFAMRLLSLPEIVGWYARQALSLYEKYSAQLLMVAPMFGAGLPLPSGQLIGRASGLVSQLRELPLILADPTITSTRLILSPDRLALEEAKRAYAQLCLYGLNADCVVLNGTLPESVQDPFFKLRREAERSVQELADLAFAPLMIHRVPLLEGEAIGLAALNSLADVAWPTTLNDPTMPLSEERAVRISPEGGKLLVSIKLPYVAASDVDLAKSGNELYITVGNHRRHLLLPPDARDMQPVKAKFSEGRLLVTLARPE